MVDSMLGPNRIIKHEPVNIHKVLERVRALLIAEHPDVTVNRDYDPSLPDLSGDESQMIQAVLNVARNAVQAMSDAETPLTGADSTHPCPAPVHFRRRAAPASERSRRD
ncbi:hypothetical protein HAALTHF_05780n [Vreelandella aquamarina]|nr:hypothetical protein HAALTHF_05780n [Halomonas axialensis]